jgi:hypothetical protein
VRSDYSAARHIVATACARSGVVDGRPGGGAESLMFNRSALLLLAAKQ